MLSFSKVATVSLSVIISVFLSACTDTDTSTEEIYTTHSLLDNTGMNPMIRVAGQVESAADKLFAQSSAMVNQFGGSPELDTQSCHLDDTAVITIYSTNGMAQHEIDVLLDGSSVGSLKTYFPDDEPGCKTPTDDGVITLMIPAGKHTLDAASSNLSWPTHNFAVEKCECMSLPLS